MQKDKKTNRKDFRTSERERILKQIALLPKLAYSYDSDLTRISVPAVIRPVPPIRTPYEERMDKQKYPTNQPISKSNLGLSSNKNILFVLIGIGVIGAAYYYYKKVKK